ncbi:MFS transporter [Streptomyces coryli]|uniref:MFS transporter n=1 Tax=Streptomyces coryli TaxID=1128680 RepID=UPI0030B8EA6D
MRQTVLGLALILTTALAALALADTGIASATAILVLWGLGYGAVPVTFQTWILKSAPDDTEAASSLYVSAFNLSIALGALLGGFAVNALSTTSVLWLGAALAALTLLVAAGRRTAETR